MYQKHLNLLCQHYKLGSVKREPQRVTGGLLHTMWRVDTNLGSYAIKQLSTDIIPNERVSQISERVAANFVTHGIPAVSAIEISGKYLFMFEGTGYLVYPWVEAKALDQHMISENHALKIAAILAKMHTLNLSEPEMNQAEFYTRTNKEIIELIEKSELLNCSFANSLRINQENILAANESYHNAIHILKNETIVSHGDLDQKNVLWDSDNNPILIDWEAACKINPTYDIINTAFYWSGITTQFNKELFFKMINTYQKSGGIINKDHFPAACNGALNWINWLMRNIERSCVKDESIQKTEAIEQVNQTLATILRLQRVIPDILSE